MKKVEKLVFALGTAAIVGVATYEIIKKKSKEFYEEYYKAGSEPLKMNTWLANVPSHIWKVQNSQGLELVGYHIPKGNAKFTMVIVHGYRGRALNMNKHAKAFYEQLDCDLFLPDLRGHGNSQGDKVGWGWEDKEDIKVWVKFLSEKLPNRPIVIFGESMGGATVNYLACEDMPNVKALVEDCGFSDLYEEFNFQAKNIVHLPFAPFYKSFNEEVEKNHRYNIKDVSCLKCVEKAKYPMMFIHGLKDEIVPCQMAFDLYNACPTEKQLFLVKEAKHTQCIRLDEEGYMTTLKEFLEEHV